MSTTNKFKGIRRVTRAPTAAIIAGRIRSAIMDGPFAPGDQLGEAQLAAALGVSRGPVREALQRLIQEGLLRSEPNRGVFVVQLDEEDLRDIYYARTIVERAAALRLLERNNPQDLDELKRCVDEMRRAARDGDAGSVADWDLQFHKTLTHAARSKRLTRMFDTLISETRIALAGGSKKPQLDKAVIDEHSDLLEALRAGDRRRALLLVQKHMDSGVRRRMDKLRGDSAQGAPNKPPGIRR